MSETKIDVLAADTERAPDLVALEAPRELKVRVPARLHLKLHIAKVRTGRPIADLLTQALDDFFERHPELGRVPEQG